MVDFESQYTKYSATINGQKTFLYASKHLTLKEAKDDIKVRFVGEKVTNIKQLTS